MTIRGRAERSVGLLAAAVACGLAVTAGAQVAWRIPGYEFPVVVQPDPQLASARIMGGARVVSLDPSFARAAPRAVVDWTLVHEASHHHLGHVDAYQAQVWGFLLSSRSRHEMELAADCRAADIFVRIGRGHELPSVVRWMVSSQSSFATFSHPGSAWRADIMIRCARRAYPRGSYPSVDSSSGDGYPSGGAEGRRRSSVSRRTECREDCREDRRRCVDDGGRVDDCWDEYDDCREDCD